MASSYTSAKLAPPISGATVDAFEIRPDQQLWYTIQVHPCPMVIPEIDTQPVLHKSYSICRRHGDVVDFVERLEEEFPWLKAYQDESQVKMDRAWSSNRSRDGTTLFDASRSVRQQELNRYFQTLFTLESIVIQCRLVSEFFGTWKTDLQCLLRQEDQNPLALHTISLLAPTPTKWPASSNSSSSAVDPRLWSNSSLSTPPWSPDNMSSSSSVNTSPALSPTMPPSPEKKRGCSLWDARMDLLDSSAVDRCNIVSPPGSSFHSSYGSEYSDDASSYYTYASDEESDTYSIIMSKFPETPSTFQTPTSLQNLTEFIQRLPSTSSSFPTHFSSSSSPHLPLPRALPVAPSVTSIVPQHKLPRSFGEGTLQSELSSPLNSIPPRTVSLVLNNPDSGVGPSIPHRRPSSLIPEVRSRRARQGHTRTPSNPTNNACNNSCNNSTGPITIPPKPATRLLAKAQASVSSSPLSISPLLTVPPRSISKPTQSITIQPQEKKAKEKIPMTPTLRVVPKATTTSRAPLKSKLAKTSTAPLNIKAPTPAKRILTIQKPPSIVADCMAGISNFTINLNATSGLDSSACSNPQSPSESRPSQSIIATLNQAHAQKQVSTQKTTLAHQRQQPVRFVATIKVVVNAHLIIALKILEEETEFLLSVPDLRLRVMNKFRRMSMAIPDEFDLVWNGGNGSQVVLKNDEEIQKALRASVNNKLTLRCVF
ncbi:hypothetical protein EC957_011839 [Mortierella hygrophila]|uniref:PX domain-containing protein n=1 Tax=Mortierella hygrophila TaxID=979708 RepID=A0A9P6F836_9FUNG|nr:hypothetical protein EC957_011839 [Mortierella hygrophila]